MKLLLKEAIRKVDAKAIKAVGLTELVLMENAGRAVADAADVALEGAGEKQIVIFVGKGNNGGDGLVAARLLENLGAFVYVIMLNNAKEFVGSAAQELKILKSCNAEVFAWTSSEKNKSKIFSLCAGADLFIDAMLGIGFKGELTGNYLKAVELMEQLPVPVIAIDIPSGVEANTGHVSSRAVHAQITVTMLAPKPGLYLYPGAAYSGNVIVANIGLPASLLKGTNSKQYLLDEEMIIGLLPVRAANSHKGMNGRISVLAGSSGFTGAAALCSEAVVRGGGGLVNLLTPQSQQGILATKLTEVMVKGINSEEDGALNEGALSQVQAELTKADVLAIGPGLGQNKKTQDFVRALIKKLLIPTVLDADALNALAGYTGILNNVPAKIVTPHPGEMARLTGLKQEEILANPIKVAVDYAKKWQAVVVLKCTPTVVALPNGKVFINSTGNAGMATGGSGDVLTGTIAALLGQGLSVGDAAICGVYIHGLAGDIAAENGIVGMKASDITTYLPRALQSLLLY
ncbi:Bifunctional NAD(P)H-hydrate repair enzyme Nnr [bioreactor metagenome]|uniref:Nicotinamide nucleotide repair protein n=1 Tax=bioreactor metagenome TaxID=1076179 RepID=A0A644V581_9ZZZZ|nr:NAD(P)H-hydrate dehydratase [Acidaminococcaceae bacterium]NLU44564.1 NAD(P)H-hydrate dehydratase [Acholeplasmataceae bacterium]